METSMPVALSSGSGRKSGAMPKSGPDSDISTQQADYKSYSEVNSEQGIDRSDAKLSAEAASTDRELGSATDDETGSGQDGNPLPLWQPDIAALNPVAEAVVHPNLPVSPVTTVTPSPVATSEVATLAVKSGPQIGSGTPPRPGGAATTSAFSMPQELAAALGEGGLQANGAQPVAGTSGSPVKMALEGLRVRLDPGGNPGLAIGSGSSDGSSNSALMLLQTLSDGSVLTRATAQAQPPLQLPTHVNQWGDAIGERVVWMAGQQLQQATLRIHPQHLGPLEINLTLQQDQASVTFNSPHAVVREAIEASVPRMRELFAQQQMQLVQVDVGQRDPGGYGTHSQDGGLGQGAGDPRTAGSFSGRGVAASEDEALNVPLPSRQGIGLLDDYA